MGGDPWKGLHYVGFDLETTGVDVEQDRVVTSSLVYAEPGAELRVTKLMANPGIEIPQGASDVHGITNDMVRASGQDPVYVIGRTMSILQKAIDEGWPIVGMNLAFDFTLLDREARRRGIEPLKHITPVIDVSVIDREVDMFRPGKRKLTDLCDHYGVVHGGAHDSTHDVIASMRIMWNLFRKYKWLTQESPYQLHHRQVVWRAKQIAHLIGYKASIGEPLEDPNGEWPVRSFPPTPWQYRASEPSRSGSAPRGTASHGISAQSLSTGMDAFQARMEARQARVKDCRDPWCLADEETTCGREPAAHFVTNPELTNDLLTGNLNEDAATAPKVKQAVRDALSEYPDLIAERHALAIFAERFDIEVVGIITQE